MRRNAVNLQVREPREHATLPTELVSVDAPVYDASGSAVGMLLVRRTKVSDSHFDRRWGRCLAAQMLVGLSMASAIDPKRFEFTLVGSV